MTAPATAPLPSLRYDRLLRALPRYRWWRPLVAVLLTGILWIVFQTVFAAVFVVIAIAAGEIPIVSLEQAQRALEEFLSIQTTSPLSFIASVGGVATLLPAALLGYLCVGLRPLSVLRSVMFRIRWRWLALCLLPALLITVVATAADAWLLPLFGDGAPPVAPTVPLATYVVAAVVIVVVTPVQAAAEEFAFRGVVAQAVGSWVRPIAVSLLVSTVAFAAAHTQYLGWATLDVATFGLVAGLVTWRSGGVEAAIALHAVNNTLAFLVLASGAQGSTQGADLDHPTAGDPWSLVVTVVTMGAYLAIVELLVRRRRMRTVLDPLPAPAVPAPGPVPAPTAPAPPPPDPATRRAE